MSGWLQNCFLHVCDNWITIWTCGGTWTVGCFGTIVSQLPLETICAIKSFIPSPVLSQQSRTSAHPEEKIYIKSLSGSSPAQDTRVLSAAKTLAQYSITFFGFIKPQGRLLISISPLNTQTYFPLKTLIFASLSTPSYTAVSIIITLYKRPRTESGYLSMFAWPHFLPGEHQNNLKGLHLVHMGWHTLVISGTHCHPKGNDAGDKEKGFMLKVSCRVLALVLLFQIFNSTRVLHSWWWGTQLCQCPGFAQREACRKARGSIHSPRATAADKPAPTQSQASDMALVRLLSLACLFSGGPVAALWFSWFLTDLAGFHCSSVLLAGRTTKSGGFMCPGTHAGAGRKASFQGEEVFADRCLCLKCPCVFRPWSIGAWEHSALGTCILLSPGYVK